ncbi:ATP-binding protein [Streptomyces sp. NPDC003077]|uniref:ATP-binding protein n=1 Tax=Streptomyces sp. NPDC003077 TaxID=3154443 RepID=UPI0033B9B79A
MTEPHETMFRLCRSPRNVPRARGLLRSTLHAWHIDQDAAADAELVLSELVTNALRARAPKDRQVEVCVSPLTGAALVRLEVSDAGAGRPVVRPPCEGESCGRGLWLVETLARSWGVRERACGIGKTVWAELPAPGLSKADEVKELTAATIQPGQRVRIRDSWHAVRTVRGERYPSGALAVVLGLDDGPALRLPAAEPLLVRDGTAPPTGGTDLTG